MKTAEGVVWFLLVILCAGTVLVACILATQP
jgi:hypothetical protein